MLMKYRMVSVFLASSALWSCASAPTPPREIVEARSSYARAAAGPASRHAMVDLHAAQLDLERAEASYRESPTGSATVDLAYIADRHARTAEVRGETLQSDQDRARSDAAGRQLTTERLAQTQVALQGARDAQGQTAQQLNQTAQQLETERQARVAAEQQAAAAVANLRRLAAVREEQRGMVITLSGAVIFVSGASTLLPTAQDRLTQVARALREQGGRRLTVEGHTDAQGSASTNQTLSQERAMAVRNFLVSQGIPAAQIEAVGLGSSAPVATNDTAEGRANNRRVQIIVAPREATPATATAPGSTPGTAPVARVP